MLLCGHVEFPVWRVVSFWQDMLAGRFGLIGVQVLNSSLNRLVPQLALQYEVVVQGPKMKGAGEKVLAFFCEGSILTCAMLIHVALFLLHIC